MSRANRDKYMAIFKQADLDDSGELSKDELSAILVKLGKQAVGIDRLFSKVDEDGTGTIDQFEFLDFMKELDNAWIRVQQKTFTRWVNTVLSNALIQIQDVTRDLSDGTKLVILVGALTKKENEKNK